MLISGRYILFPGTPRQLIVPNLVTEEGAIQLLRMTYQGAVDMVALGGNFYIGLCNNNANKVDDLTDIVEPTVTNGYARQVASRDATGWPTVDSVNSIGRAQSKVLTFTASGGAFSAAVSRAFLTNVASGTSGKLFSYSAPFPSSITVSSTGDPGTVTNITMVYEPFLKGN